MSAIHYSGTLQKMFYSYLIHRDKKRGVDFYAPAENGEQGRPDSEAGNRYWASSPLYNRSIKYFLRHTGVCAGSIMDVGCGKGRMLEFFAAFGFSKIAGLEYSPELAEIGRKNMETLKLPCEVFTGDATTFDGYDAYNYFYLFNPFPQAIMEQFVAKLQESLQRNPRKITIMYANPKCLSAFTENGFQAEWGGLGRHKFRVITNVIK